MPAVILVLLALMPQLVDRTNELTPVPPATTELAPEKRADLFMARKMYREAVETYELALNTETKSARLYNKLGIAYHHQIMLYQARKNYARAVNLDNNYSQAINNLGTIYSAERKYKKAVRTYRKALKYAPQSASIYSNLGTALFARRKYKKATEAYLTALQFDPEVFERRNSMGTLLQSRTVTDRAQYYYFMAKAYAAAEIYDRALLNLRRAIEEGYTKLNRLPKEPVFEPLLENAEFQALLHPGEQRAELQP